MIVPIVAIPLSIELGLAPYRDLFPRIETYQHIKEYYTGLVVLEKPSINLALLEHISPIEWDNVVLYGEYVLNRELIRRS
jgi:hypothetical protein